MEENVNDQVGAGKKTVVTGKKIPDLRDNLGPLGAIVAEFREKYKVIEELKKEKDQLRNSKGRDEYHQKEDEIEIKKEELGKWLEEELRSWEGKKQENLEKFKKARISISQEDIIKYVCNGKLTIEDYLNLYKEWDDTKLNALVNSFFCYGQSPYLGHFLKNYDDIKSLDIEKAKKIQQSAGIFFNSRYDGIVFNGLSLLKEFNKTKISDEKLNALNDLRKWPHCPWFLIENPHILEDSSEIPIELIRQCITKGVSDENMTNILNYSASELQTMIDLHDHLGITFDWYTNRDSLRKKFDFDNLKTIAELFGEKKDHYQYFHNYDVDEIAGIDFKMEKLKKFHNTLQTNGLLPDKVELQHILDLNKLDEVKYKKVLENILKFKKLGVKRVISTSNFRYVNFLSEFSEDWRYKVPNGDRPQANLERIVVYPFLVTCSLEGLGFLYDVGDIGNGKFSGQIDALLNDDYDPTVKDPSRLKQYLNIDRDGLQKLHCMGIYPTLDFFVQYDEEKQEYQRINSEINVENFEKIHNNKYKVEIENSNIMQHIQEGKLTCQDASNIIWYSDNDSIEEKMEKFKNIDDDLEKYRKPDIEGTDYCSLDQALEIMNKCVKDHSQGEPSKE